MTWNFPTWQCNDWPQDPVGRGRKGAVFTLGPGSRASGTTNPFAQEITGVFSFLIRDGWTDVSGLDQGIISIGNYNSGFTSGIIGLWAYLVDSGTTPGIRIQMSSTVSGLGRYASKFGDEDGASWLQTDKWYQVGFSANDSTWTYVINGSTTPKESVIANNPGNIDLNDDLAQSRIWVGGPKCNINFTNPQFHTSDYPSMVLGPAAWLNTYTDFSDATVRARIWDANGNFIYPGEDGSLWWGDTYSENRPLFYFPVGVPWDDQGTHGETWRLEGGGTGDDGCWGAVGGLRTHYE